ncbi:MAG: hypothetical protein PUE08_00900 [Eubacteriales bacterium]|nr:hypothetical protein [Eubacteriales bacterium]
MTMYLLFLIRLLFIFCPIIVLTVLLIKKKITVMSITLVIVLAVNSFCMIFSAHTQKNIITVDGSTITKAQAYCNSETFSSENTCPIFVYSEDEYQMATFYDITYKEFDINGNSDLCVENIKNELGIKNRIKWCEIDGTKYYNSDLVNNLSPSSLLYNSADYTGYSLLAIDDKIYCIEYSLDLIQDSRFFDGIVSDIFEQTFYRESFNKQISLNDVF